MSTPKPRTVSGIVAPFGKVGRTSAGNLRFDAQSITMPAELSRVKLLLGHDPERAIGYAIAHEKREEGDWVQFAVDDSPEATAALVSASRRVKDGFSVGIELTAESSAAVSRDPDMKSGTLARGQAREVSLLAIPAFDDARVDDVTADDLKLPAAAAAGPVPVYTPGDNTMTRHLVTAAGPRMALAGAPTGLLLAAGLAGAQQDQQPSGTEPAQPDAQAGTQPATPAEPSTEPAQPHVQAGAQPATPERPAQTPSPAGGSFTTAGAGEVIYAFDGSRTGHSFVRDIFAAHEGHVEAMLRLNRFRQAMQDETSAQTRVMADLAARVKADGTLTTAAVVVRDATNDNLRPDVNRWDQLLRAIDVGRPFVSRVRQLPLSGPDPFRLPTLGSFSGVADHTEGEAGNPEGTMEDVGAQVVVPTAVDGSYRLSRELAESNNAYAWDQIVFAEMVKEYRDNSEARLVAVLELARAASQAAFTTPADLLKQLVTFYVTQRKRPPTVSGMGGTAFADMATVEASDGRPYFPFKNAVNAAGTSEAGFAAINVQGVDGIPAWSASPLDTWLLHGPDVASFESAPRLFTFNEVEGPGIIKLAIWGYQAAHVYRTEGVRRLNYVAPV